MYPYSHNILPLAVVRCGELAYAHDVPTATAVDDSTVTAHANALVEGDDYSLVSCSGVYDYLLSNLSCCCCAVRLYAA